MKIRVQPSRHEDGLPAFVATAESDEERLFLRDLFRRATSERLHFVQHSHGCSLGSVGIDDFCFGFAENNNNPPTASIAALRGAERELSFAAATLVGIEQQITKLVHGVVEEQHAKLRYATDEVSRSLTEAGDG